MLTLLYEEYKRCIGAAPMFVDLGKELNKRDEGAYKALGKLSHLLQIKNDYLNEEIIDAFTEARRAIIESEKI